MRGLEVFCDVTLVSEDNIKVRAHKVVLASASTLFRDLFLSNEEESEYEVINLRGVSSRCMTALCDLIYEGETKVKERECKEFLEILQQYNLLKENPEDPQTRTCKYYNRGFCKVGPECAFIHSKSDCENHMMGKHCGDHQCKQRHSIICKYWDSPKGCFRHKQCQYLHEDQNDDMEIKCYVCKFWYEKDLINVHKIKDHEFKLCLQCEFTIKNKEVLLKKTFCLKELLRNEYPDISKKELERLVKS